MTEYSLLSVLVSISVFQILLLSGFLFFKRKGCQINKLLIILLLTICGIFVTGSFILLMKKQALFVYDIAHLMNLGVFLVAPLLYVHFNNLFKGQIKLSGTDFLHAIPFLMIFSYFFFEIVIMEKLKYVFYPTAIYLISALFVQNIVYFYLIFKDLKTISPGLPDKSKIKLYKILFASAAILFSLKFVIFIVWNILRYNEICIFITSIFFIIVFIIINSIMLFSLNNPSLLLGAFRYQQSTLNSAELGKYLAIIDRHMADKEIFTDPLISLERLSKNLYLPEKVISQVINRTSGLNFNDFINRYRVNLAKNLIIQDPGRKILEVAYECGFNSKTTFNTSFKKFAGVTPSEFKKITLN